MRRGNVKTGVNDCDAHTFADFDLAEVAEADNSAAEDFDALSCESTLVIELSLLRDVLDSKGSLQQILDANLCVIASFRGGVAT